MAKQENRSVVVIALAGNGLIAASKFFAAAFTGSSAMLSEAVHSAADTANELLMLYGLARAQRPPTVAHPFGQGREVYFWSFIVALLIFLVGAGVSFYDGIAHWLNPRPVSHLLANYVVLALSCVFEGISWSVAVRRIRRTKGRAGYFEAMRRSKDPTVFTVLIEDSAALIGLLLAFAGITLAAVTGKPQFDAVASLLIGVLLCATSYFLARETKALLIGEPAHAHVQSSILRIAAADPAIARANGIVTAQLGPDHVLAALSAEFEDDLSTGQIEACVGRLETAVKAAHPEVVALFLKPQAHSVWSARRATLAAASTA
ncbi:MAG TPA: cation diffusion facilitator family transporter [Dokdonella sp.]